MLWAIFMSEPSDGAMNMSIKSVSDGKLEHKERGC